MIYGKHVWTLLIVVLVGIGSLLSINRMTAEAHAAPQSIITVNSNADTLADDGICTLREAITAANTDTPSGSEAGECGAGNGTDTILFDFTAPTTITIDILGFSEDANTTGDFDIVSSLTISTTPADGITVDGAQYDRVFDVFTDTVVTIQGVTIQHGLSPTSFGGSDPLNESGGGIRNSGTLLLNEVYLFQNATATGEFLPDDFPTGGAGPGGWGGGIASIGNQASLSIHNSVIHNNYAGNGGDCEGDDCLGGQGGSGGGLYATGVVTITNSIIADNHAGNSGVPIGPIGGEGSLGGGDGGGIMLETTAATISSSTIVNNVAGGTAPGQQRERPGDGGGLYSDGLTVIEHSTISGNATQGENGTTYGGGVYGTNLTAQHSTIANNQTTGNTSGGGGIAGTVTLFNTLIGDNTGATGAECVATVTSEGYNLIESVTALCVITGDTATNVYGDDPQLEPLADNGGNTLTHALMETSPALDDGSCPVGVDQRGAGRPVDIATLPNADNGCDIGAYELQTNTAPTRTTTPTPSNTPTITLTPGQTSTPTRTSTATVTPTKTPTVTRTPSPTYTATATLYPTYTPYPPYPTYTPYPTHTPFPTWTPAPNLRPLYLPLVQRP